jgi:hypothetical protein
MGNPVLLVTDAGYGETPACPEAKFKPGDVVKWRRMGDGYIVAVAVPPGFPAEYALADLTKTARPLMIRKPSRAIQYVMVREGDPRPYLAREANITATGQKVELGSVLFANGGE